MHMHTIASGHAYETIREMAEAAAEKGLTMIGITEHAPGIPGTCDPFYYNNFGVVPGVLNGVEVYFGSEINVLNNGTLSLEQQYIDKLDYAVAGIHMQCYKNAGKEKNTDNVISCMKNEKVKLISHPDDDHTPLDYERLVEAAGKYHTALEVNNSSLVKKDKRLNCYENYRLMLELCEKSGVPVVISSDAHDPSWVGEFTLAEKLILENGFDQQLVLNNDPAALKKFFGLKEEKVL